jgi:ABC-type uncharacterized transport system involved in gliding motility auxiliary subunit
MEVTRKTRAQARLENAVFVVLFLAVMGLLGWLSTRYSYQADWTASGRNTLSPASRALLKEMKDPVGITAFARENEPLRRHISEVIARYQRYKPDIKLEFINPDTAPEQVRKLAITVDGELLLQYQGRSEKVQNLSEQSLTNALQRVARGGERWAVFLQGHGERNPQSMAPPDLGFLARELRAKGFKAQGLNLASQAQIPDNTTILVVASPQNDLLQGEVKILQDYIDRGGSLLWLLEPGSLHGLKPLADKLGIKVSPGIVVDPAAVQLFGAAFALVAEYGASPITRSLNAITLFPEAVGLELTAPAGWQGDTFLESSDKSWAETGDLSGELAFDKGKDVAGPLALGVSLERDAPEAKGQTGAKGEQPQGRAARKQRVIVVGDGDFLSDAYVGNAGNLLLGLDIFNWLSQDEGFIAIPPKTSPDVGLELGRAQMLVIGFGSLLVLPLLLAGQGLLIWLRRRKR